MISSSSSWGFALRISKGWCKSIFFFLFSMSEWRSIHLLVMRQFIAFPIDLLAMSLKHTSRNHKPGLKNLNNLNNFMYCLEILIFKKIKVCNKWLFLRLGTPPRWTYYNWSLSLSYFVVYCSGWKMIYLEKVIDLLRSLIYKTGMDFATNSIQLLLSSFAHFLIVSIGPAWPGFGLSSLSTILIFTPGSLCI